MTAKRIFTGLFLVSAASGALQAQISRSAYRVLGQPDLYQNGTNMVQGLELYAPAGVALDGRDGPLHLYIADTHNSRVMAWQDAHAYQNGDPPALILGQPGAQYSVPLGIGLKGFNGPEGLAVDPTTGNLYVADAGNNRVLRFPAPFANPANVEPDRVYGQPDFNSRTANTGGISNASMSKPFGVAVDSAGNLWVADTGNHRVLRFRAATLDSNTPPPADMVIGQMDFSSGTKNRGGAVSASGLDTPAGLAFDSQNNLYVSDFNNTRVLKFAAPFSPGTDPAAVAVFGEANFTSRGVPQQAANWTLAGPTGLAVDGSGALYVAVPIDNRVMVFAAGTASGGAAGSVLGQSDFSTTKPNANVFPKASENTLAGVSDVKVDSAGNVYAADTGNNRVLMFPQGSKSATRLWGQVDFSTNGPNEIKPSSINAAYKIAVDYSKPPFALYVSDINNQRVLGWRDAARFRNGDPADIVIGQPDFRTAIPNIDTGASTTPSATSLAFPKGIAVDASGNLYVADSANNRVLRFPRPVDQSGRITPNAVLGQTGFESAASATVSASSLRSPAGVAVGANGDIFVADSGNNRVLEFPAGAGTGAAAIRVYGQPNFTSGTAPTSLSAQTLAGPQGLFLDASNILYVADTGANRILIYTQNSATTGLSASYVLGQNGFDSFGGGTGTNLKAPADVATDSNGNIYVSDNGNNRVLIFPALLNLAIPAKAAAAVGQKDVNGTAVNWNTTDGRATPEGLYSPLGILVDRRDTLYVGDSGNNRVVHFLRPTVAVNAAHFLTGVPVAQGSLAAMGGPALADTTATAQTIPLPMALAERQVVVNDTLVAPLLYVGPTQINFQVPSASPVGTDRIAVRLSDTGELVAGGSLLVAASSPGMFTFSADGTGQAAALNVNSDGSVTVNGPSNPAPKGSIISLYGTGQGQVSPAVADGVGASAAPLSNTVAIPTSDGKTCLTVFPSMCVAIESAFGDVTYTGLAPGFAGLWQINVRIPQNLPANNAARVRVVINGAPSNIVTVAIR